LSLTSSASTASHDPAPTLLSTSSTSATHFSSPPKSDDSNHENSSLAPNTRIVGTDTSYALLGLSSPSLAPVAKYGSVEESGLNQAAARPSVGVMLPLASPVLPYPQVRRVPMATNICYTCNKSFKCTTTLTKHRNEFCERKAEWFCPLCPGEVFGLQDRLNRHHVDKHADSCRYCCDKKEKPPSAACKLSLSKCSRQLETKKAWGCPCCIEYFESFEERSHHVSNHPIQDGKLQDWSNSTLIWSLLKHPYISAHVTREYFQYCNWSTLDAELSLSLRHALERHELPAAVSTHVDYCGLDGPAALARYAFNLGTSGKAHQYECKTHKRSGVGFNHSPPPTTHISDGTADSSHYQSARVAHSPVGWSLPTGRATIPRNTISKSEVHPSFRERVSSQANCRQIQSRQKTTEPTNPHRSEVEGPRHLPPFHSSGICEYGHVNGLENPQVFKYSTSSPPYVQHPPMTLHDGSTSSPSYPPGRGDFKKPARTVRNPDDWEPRRLQTKKSQANLHTRFAHNRSPPSRGYEDPPLPIPFQNTPVHYLENNSRGLASERAIPQRPQTASSRSATPARSDTSQESWTKFLNMSSCSLPGSQYPVAMSLCGPASDVDMSLA
jgi:hypothetical protein